MTEFNQYYMPYSKTESGTITSDTAMRHYLCLAVVEAAGRVSPPEVADVLWQHLNPDRVWINEEIILKKISAGLNPWDVGRGAVPDSKATSAVTPIGIINAGNPDQAYQDGLVIAAMMDYSTGIIAHGADIALGYAEAADSIDDFVETLYDRFIDWRWPAVQWNR